MSNTEEGGIGVSELPPAVFVLTQMRDFSCRGASLAPLRGAVQGRAHPESLDGISVLRKLYSYRVAGAPGGSEFLTWRDTGLFKFMFRSQPHVTNGSRLGNSDENLSCITESSFGRCCSGVLFLRHALAWHTPPSKQTVSPAFSFIRWTWVRMPFTCHEY